MAIQPMAVPRPLRILDERPDDAAAIRRVIESAFKGRTEADVVDKLRAHDRFVISLVAVIGGTIAGHVLLTKVEMLGDGPSLPGLGLAPLAVRPVFQRRGVGAALMQSALERAREAGYGFVVLLGNPAYYRRFGFHTASRFGLSFEFEAPDEAFLAIELVPNALAGVSGVVRYLPEFTEGLV